MQHSREWEARIPKYIKLTQHLRNQVQTGVLKPGERLPTLGELSKEHRVSFSTVEKVHSILEHEGLIIREQGRGVFVAEPSTRLTSAVTIGLIAELYAEIAQLSFWMELFRGLQETASHARAQLMVVNDITDIGLWEKIDGMLVCTNQEYIQFHTALVPSKVPIISLINPSDKLTSVVFDDYQGAKDATKHLLSLGHKKIAFLVAVDGNDILKNRLRGYQDALREAGIEPKAEWLRYLEISTVLGDSGTQYLNRGRSSVRLWLKKDWMEQGITAVFCQNDYVALSAMEAFQEAGIRVPQDVSIVGFDGTKNPEFESISLTTVEVPVREAAVLGVEMILKEIKLRQSGEASLSEKVVLKTRLKKGHTTAKPRTGK